MKHVIINNNTNDGKYQTPAFRLFYTTANKALCASMSTEDWTEQEEDWN